MSNNLLLAKADLKGDTPQMSNLIPIIDTHMHLWETKHPELKWVWLDKDASHPILGNIDAIKSVSYVLRDLWAEDRFSGISGFVQVQAEIGSPDTVTETVPEEPSPLIATPVCVPLVPPVPADLIFTIRTAPSTAAADTVPSVATAIKSVDKKFVCCVADKVYIYFHL